MQWIKGGNKIKPTVPVGHYHTGVTSLQIKNKLQESVGTSYDKVEIDSLRVMANNVDSLYRIPHGPMLGHGGDGVRRRLSQAMRNVIKSCEAANMLLAELHTEIVAGREGRPIKHARLEDAKHKLKIYMTDFDRAAKELANSKKGLISACARAGVSFNANIGDEEAITRLVSHLWTTMENQVAMLRSLVLDGRSMYQNLHVRGAIRRHYVNVEGVDRRSWIR
jgi:hypothetical protein